MFHILNCGFSNQVSYDHRSYERNLSNRVEKREKVRYSTAMIIAYLITIIITLEGIEKIKTWKKNDKNSLKDISFTKAIRKRQQTLASRFTLDIHGPKKKKQHMSVPISKNMIHIVYTDKNLRSVPLTGLYPIFLLCKLALS